MSSMIQFRVLNPTLLLAERIERTRAWAAAGAHSNIALVRREQFSWETLQRLPWGRPQSATGGGGCFSATSRNRSNAR